MEVTQSQLTLKQIKQNLIEKNCLMIKDFTIGFPTGDEALPMDDFFLLSDKGYQNFKVSKIIIFENQKKEVVAIQFTYKQYQNQKNNENYEIKGNLIGQQETSDLLQKSINLQDDQFITKITIQVEFIIGNITIILSNGREYFFGNYHRMDYEYFEFSAPKGFHFTCFSGCTSSHFNGLCLLKADVCPIEQHNNRDHKSKFIEIIPDNKSVLRLIIPFLTVKEISVLMRTCTLLAKLISNEDLFIDEIERRALFSGNSNLNKYYQKIISKYSKDSEKRNILISYEDCFKNYVENPNGDDQFQNFQFLQGNQEAEKNYSFIENLNGLTHFKFSFIEKTLVWEKYLHDLFTSKSIENIENRQLAIVFGIEIADSNYGGSLRAKVIIEDQEQNSIFQQKQEFSKIQRGFKFYNIASYVKSQQSKPHKIIFSISGKDSRFWKGHFGPRLRSITCKLIPIQNKQQINLFKNTMKNIF
ncbi:F-box protein (macronuclear) [Tetrahymena thermophila SB210]|uniref:F-box protein n=1 Tax=Tetrahymena thermophila (strain SB210) TaxID=312017 RepID=Q23A86_TETTS|nr:F-box protein [Tetrahymena thermophila SB210]EAR93394.2 F-box protein [Tetrahymena thermophila SB210]|eukprot:XP_001013639.2 F-box protein [Tetrahymena thermophila SB210]